MPRCDERSSTDNDAGRRLVRWSAGLALAVAALVATGCVRPLLSPTDERSPFDRYDGIRNQYATQSVPDEYGRSRPNLRERLAPKE